MEYGDRATTWQRSLCLSTDYVKKIITGQIIVFSKYRKIDGMLHIAPYCRAGVTLIFTYKYFIEKCLHPNACYLTRVSQDVAPPPIIIELLNNNIGIDWEVTFKGGGVEQEVYTKICPSGALFCPVDAFCFLFLSSSLSSVDTGCSISKCIFLLLCI